MGVTWVATSAVRANPPTPTAPRPLCANAQPQPIVEISEEGQEGNDTDTTLTRLTVSNLPRTT